MITQCTLHKILLRNRDHQSWNVKFVLIAKRRILVVRETNIFRNSLKVRTKLFFLNTHTYTFTKNEIGTESQIFRNFRNLVIKLKFITSLLFCMVFVQHS